MKNEETMTDLERLMKLETRIDQQEKDICQMFADIREIKDRLLGRPSWAVSIIITVLSSLCLSLIILIVK